MKSDDNFVKKGIVIVTKYELKEALGASDDRSAASWYGRDLIEIMLALIG